MHCMSWCRHVFRTLYLGLLFMTNFNYLSSRLHMDMTSSSSSFVHCPVVDENMTPRLGMHFDDLDEAYNFYNAYGKLAGFSIRKESSNRGKDGEVVWKRFVCSKEGKTDEKHWIGKELV